MVEEVNELRREVATAKQEMAEIDGRLTERYHILNEKFNLKDLKSAEVYLEKQKAGLASIENEMKSILDKIKKEYQW
jgi:hypothetical protein